MYQQHGALHHMDVLSGATVYRVFLLASTLQVDIAFWPAAEFGATAPTFRLIFGTAVTRAPSPPPAAAQLIGLGWLYALHARSSLARGRAWQAARRDLVSREAARMLLSFERPAPRRWLAGLCPGVSV